MEISRDNHSFIEIGVKIMNSPQYILNEINKGIKMGMDSISTIAVRFTPKYFATYSCDILCCNLASFNLSFSALIHTSSIIILIVSYCVAFYNYNVVFYNYIIEYHFPTPPNKKYLYIQDT